MLSIENTVKTSRHTNPVPCEGVHLTGNEHLYAHGSGFALATEVLADPAWGAALQKVEPKLLASCDRLLNSNKRILDGTTAGKIISLMENSPVLAAYARAKIGANFKPELDVWIDPSAPARVERSKVAHGNSMTLLISRLPVVGSMVLHSALFGTSLATAFSVDEWFDKYKQALEEVSRLRGGKGQDVVNFTWEEVRPAAVCLDIKSPWSTATDVADFVKAFQNFVGQRVEFVGAFDRNQLTRLPKGVAPVYFFHAVWDIIREVRKRPLAGYVLFNGADLLKRGSPDYEVDKEALSSLRQLVAGHKMCLGIYVQESDASAEAVQRLIDLVANKEPALFKAGFALGGRRDGKVPRMLSGTGAGLQRLFRTGGWISKVIIHWGRYWTRPLSFPPPDEGKR